MEPSAWWWAAWAGPIRYLVHSRSELSHIRRRQVTLTGAVRRTLWLRTLSATIPECCWAALKYPLPILDFLYRLETLSTQHIPPTAAANMDQALPQMWLLLNFGWMVSSQERVLSHYVGDQIT